MYQNKGRKKKKEKIIKLLGVIFSLPSFFFSHHVVRPRTHVTQAHPMVVIWANHQNN